MIMPSLVSVNNVNEKITRAFTSSFKNTSNVAWYSLDKKNKNFIVHFKNDGREYKALYHKNGFLEYAVSKYTITELPKEITKNVLRSYPGYAVTAALQIITESGTSWSLNLQEGNNAVIVKVDDKAVEELAQYTLPKKPNTIDVARKN